MNRHHLDRLLATFEYPNVDNLVQCPFGHLPSADDACLHLGNGRIVLREDDTFNFTGIEEHEAKYQKQYGDEVLPPVSLSIAFEEHSELSESQVVQQIQCHDDDDCASNPHNARKAPKAQPIVRCLSDPNLG